MCKIQVYLLEGMEYKYVFIHLQSHENKLSPLYLQGEWVFPQKMINYYNYLFIVCVSVSHIIALGDVLFLHHGEHEPSHICNTEAPCVY